MAQILIQSFERTVLLQIVSSELPRLKMSQESLWRRVLRAFCPLFFGESFEDFAKTSLHFPDFKFKDVVVVLCVYILYSTFILDGLFYYLVDTHFLMLPRSSLGAFLNPVHLIFGAAVSEIATLRSYCLYARVKHGKHSIPWFNVISTMGKKAHPKLFMVTKFFFLQLWLSATTIYFCNHSTKLLLERSTPVDFVINAAWFIFEVTLLRLAVIELPVHLLMAYACFVQVNIRMDQLLVSFKQQHLGVEVLIKYIRLVKCIIDVHPFIKVVYFTNGTTVIPHISIVILIAITPAENNVQLTVKCCYFLASVLWSIRGVVMTSVVSKIDSDSRVLYKMVASRIARGQVIGHVSHSQLTLIMEDLASNKSHICMREYSGSPSNQMDVLTNVVNIAQFVMLLREFSAQLGF